MSAKSASYFGQNQIKPDFLQAQKSLKLIEQSATENSHSKKSSASSLYTGHGQKSSKNFLHHPFKAKSSSKIPYKATLFFFTTLILVIISIFTFFSSLLGAQLEDLITRATDPQYTSYTIKTKQLFKQSLAGNQSLSPYMKGRLAKQGIDVTDLDHGKHHLTYKNRTITADNFDEVISSQADFREAFSKAKRGRIANFFDSSSESIFKKLGHSRNILRNFKSTGDYETDHSNFKRTLSQRFSGNTDTRINTVEDRPITDENGETTIKRQSTGENISTSDIDGATPQARAESFLSGTARKVTDQGGIACAALKVGNLIAVSVAANEIYQSISYFLNNMESISKTKYGNGSSSGINQTLNFLKKPEDSTYVDEFGNQKTVTGAPLESEGLKFILANQSPDHSKTKHYSLERVFVASATALTTNQLTTTACQGIQATNAIISLATLAIPGGGFVRATLGFLLNTTLAVGLQFTISAILKTLIPFIATSLFTNTFEQAKGIPAGELLTKGAAATNSRIARSSSGQMPSSAKRALEYHQSTKNVLAQDAELDRINHHPLDPSNSNTFLGSLFAKSFPIFNSSTSLFGKIFSFTTLAATTLTPTIFADGTDQSYATTFGDCPRIQAIGGEGDLYCNDLVAGDPSTHHLDQNDPTYRSVLAPNLTTDQSGNTVIKPNSRLANFINYCSERDSPFGVFDANIANAMQTSLGTVGDNLPVLNDIVDIINAAEDATSRPWATGSICINSEKNPHWDSEMKYYYDYIERQRIISQMNQSDTNPVTAFKSSYEKNHPLDHSPAGYLSRISGLPKTTTSALLANLNYANYLASYQPQSAYSFLPATNLSTPQLISSSSNHTIIFAIFPLPVIYSNLRHRNLIV